MLPPSKHRLYAALLNFALLMLPLLFLEFPPSTDLPLHLVQIQMFFETLSDPSVPYEINWGSPYALSYLAPAIGLYTFPIEFAARVSLILLALFWTAGLHAFAARFRRPAWNAFLASFFFYNHLLYSGFYPFLFGWPLFLFWTILLPEGSLRTLRPGKLALVAIHGLLLYYTHLYWSAAGLIWLALNTPLREGWTTRLKRSLIALALLAPLLQWLWTSQAVAGENTFLAGSGFTERIFSPWVLNFALGGLKGNAETVFLALASSWILFGLWQNRSSFRKSSHVRSLLLAGLFLAFALFLPEANAGSLYFASRWLPLALILFIIALPSPRLSDKTALLLLAPLLLAFVLYTTERWKRYESRELQGLKEALRALPVQSRVFGLTYLRASRYIKGYPFAQYFAYARAYRQGRLNASFTDIGFTLVNYKKSYRRPWFGGLPRHPDQIKARDFKRYDFALIGAPEVVHAQMKVKRPYLQAATQTGQWRLYRVIRPGKDVPAPK